MIEDRALALLGSGITPEVVAASLGVSASRISQSLCRRGVKIRVSSTLLRGLGGRIPALGGLRRPPKAGILTASHLKGLISCENTPAR